MRWNSLSAATFLLALGLLLSGLHVFSQATTQREEWLVATLVNDHFEFPPPFPVDWETLAPDEHPDPSVLAQVVQRKDMFNNAETHFEAPLPESFQGHVFYLMSESGGQEIRAERLKGTVRYSLDDQGQIASRRLWGYVVATPGRSDPRPPVGLVLSSEGRYDLETQESTLTATQLVPPDVRKSWDLLPAEAKRFWTIQRQYSFRFGGDDATYTFVQWTPDKECYEACCEVRYSLYADEHAPRQVAGHSGQCDI